MGANNLHMDDKKELSKYTKEKEYKIASCYQIDLIFSARQT